MNRRAAFFRVIVAAALLVAVACVVRYRTVIDPSSLERVLGRFGRLAPVLFVLIYALGTVLFVPGSVLTIAGGAMFGPVWGTLWNLTGATLGASLAFITARYVASDWVAKRCGERTNRLVRGVDEEGWRFVAFVRLVPLFPFNLVNYAFGLTRIALGEYVLASFVCMAPGAFAYTYAGYAGRQAALGEGRAMRAVLFALALIAAVAFLPRFIRRIKGPRFIDPAIVSAWMRSGEKISLIDVRSADEFRGPLGHICGATNIPITQLPDKLRELAGSRAAPMIAI